MSELLINQVISPRYSDKFHPYIPKELIDVQVNVGLLDQIKTQKDRLSSILYIQPVS